ncbi:MAG: hypothetical protein B5766_00910 [Candidatus Lumbricidophila eiseniae]|uniref:Uncharacterized protein n=1 Tax=Candidatus Lumbricidiphila eiseniae TaxID=1969409 RepID=A0A2A6FU26_9MICO|nr:MAG: hypothetical protein B5766_00910 [Candidatus Lumbricidophila eiseniae]
MSSRIGLADRIALDFGSAGFWFDGEPLALETLPEGIRRVPETALCHCLELLTPVVGESYASVYLLLVFASTFATAFAHRLIVAVDDETKYVRPRDSTDMETSESVRAALAALGKGRPRGTIVLVSPFDLVLAASLAVGYRSMLVVRYELHGPEPEDCDLLAAHIRTAQSVQDEAMSEIVFSGVGLVSAYGTNNLNAAWPDDAESPLLLHAAEYLSPNSRHPSLSSVVSQRRHPAPRSFLSA